MLGRFHLVVLHLPIGFLLLAFLMEWASRRSPGLQVAVRFALFWGMTSAVIAAGLGYLLSLGGDYDEGLLAWHQWLGFGTAGLSTCLYFLHKNKESSATSQRLYLPVFWAAVLALVATGHFGGSLTHGKDFLFKLEKNAKNQAPPVTNLDSAEVFAHVVLPVLRDKCGGCHNDSKRKGDLALLTKEGILKGGETGKAIVPGKPEESLLLKNIHLPPEEDAHMPPDGKKQLTALEKKLLEWWVNTGAPFDKKIAGCNLPADLRTALLEKFQDSGSPLAGLKIDPVSDGALQNLRSEGFAIFPMAAGSPFLQVSFAHRKDLTAADFKKLKKVSKNIVQLDLRNSNMDDQLLSEVKNFPHLNRLHLDQTVVTDAGLAHLANLTFLEFLNLYKTQVTDDGLAQLKGLKNLKSAYFWQTGVSEKGIAVLTASLPKATFNRGIENDTLFGEVELLPPTLTASKELFEDTVQVALKSNFNKARIHFTLDGSEPDSTSTVYEKPLILDATRQLKAIAKAAGWKTSAAVSREFFKVKYKAQEITLSQKPDPKYAGEGGKTLGDFKRGTLNFGQGGWIAYQGKHLVATIDLGKTAAVGKVTVGTLENTGGWIFSPKGLRIATSTDGKNFKTVKQVNFPIAKEQTQPSIKNFTADFEPIQARYVKLEVKSQLENPAWHPNKGEPCWIFVDEILVE